MRKTSWKNAKKFVKALDKKKLLKSKDRDGGECVILDIEFNDPAISNFVPYKLPKKDTPGSESNGGGPAPPPNSNAADDSIGQTLTVLAFHRPKDHLAPLFTPSSANTKALYLPSELRTIIATYITSENLTQSTNKRLINLDPFLSNTVFNGNTSLDRAVIAKGTVPRDALIDRILQSSTNPFHAILRNDETRETVKPRAGAAPKVQLVLETRSGNKTVTKVSGVEVFRIGPQALGDELQKACASSVSVAQLVGSSPRHPVMEVLVQGPQRGAVLKALEKRGIRSQWVDVVDKTKKGK